MKSIIQNYSKKRIVIFIFLGLIIISTFLLFLIANNHKDDFHEEDYPLALLRESTVEIYGEDKRKIEIKNGTLTPTGATFILSNYEEILLYYNSDPYVEIQIDKKWYRIKVDLEEVVVMHFWIGAHEVKEVEDDWLYYYGELPPGKYRYIKSFSDLRESAYVACEFTITEDM